jgi:hypothetical protein
MGYWGYGRGRGRGVGRGVGRGAGYGRGMGQGFGYGSGQGFGSGFWPNLSASCRRFPERPIGWLANPAYSNAVATQYPQQNAPEYQYARPPQYMQPLEMLGYPRQPLQGLATHMNCMYYSNGTCTLRGAAVPPNGQACPSFTSFR